ncbi:MAG: hypothetical protein ACRDP7_41590 [Trebonia sp.]
MASRKIPSARWRMTGIACAVAGLVAGILLFIGLLSIDGAGAARPDSLAQGILGLSAFACLLGFGVTGLITAIQFWRQPAAQLSDVGVMVCNWRTVLVPWGMIREATTSQDRPALLLADGQVMPLRFAEAIPRAGEYQSATLDMLEVTLRGHQSKRHAARRDPGPATPTGLPRGSLIQRDLPAQIVYEVPRRRFRPSRLLAAGLPVLVGGIRLVGALARSTPLNDAQFAVALTAAAGIAAVFIVFTWSLETRTVVLGEGWIGWRPRVSRRWHVLFFSEVVSIARTTEDAIYHGVVIRRSDGRGIEIHEPQLRAGAGAALLPCLAGHPGLASDAEDTLKWATTAGPVPGWRAARSSRRSSGPRQCAGRPGEARSRSEYP